MARRSSSSRWSRPATGKQIAALKSHGNYDGKYYSMGRASQAIGRGSSGGGRGRSSGGGLSSGSAYSSLAASDLGPSRLLPRLLGVTDGLDSVLEAALGSPPASRLASSGTGPTNLLSQLLGVPDDIDSLVQAALGASDHDDSGGEPEDSAVESVLYTIRSDDSSPSEPRFVVEAEVIHAEAFEGQPSLQIRFVDSDQNGSQQAVLHSSAGTRPALGYRPRWTPVLVRTPAELAEQMRIRWREALEELQAGVDPRMETFLSGVQGMEPVLAVLASNQSPASKFVLLQGLMDPQGQIQYKGIGLDASAFAGQIRAANEGDENALDWLDEIQREEVLTSFSEVTGISLAAEADYRLSRWRKQGIDLIKAVTIKSKNAEFDFSTIRSILTTQAKNREKLATLRKSSLDDHVRSSLDKLLERFETDDASSDYGILEDWFFEETQLFLQIRFRESLPGQFAAALTSVSSDPPAHSALVAEIRRLTASSSTEPSDYLTRSVAEERPRVWLYGQNSRDTYADRRVERIVQAVRRVIADFETAEDDNLGTLIVAQEVLGYAQWKRDELRAKEQIGQADSYRNAATQRAQDAQQRAEMACHREEEARKDAWDAANLEQIVQRYSDALARTSRSINIEEPVTDAVESAAQARLKQAQLRETAAAERLVAAEGHERWATAGAADGVTAGVVERLLAERDSAVAEQSEARAEQEDAKRERVSAQRDIRLFREARTKFVELIHDVQSENMGRLRAESELRLRENARRAEELRQRDEERRRKQEAERQRQEAENKRQEDLNQRQQDRANTAKKAISLDLERLLALPNDAPFWRRKALAENRASLQQAILRLQAEIVGPLAPPRTRSKTWPNMLSRNERYLATVKKIADYGAFVSLPANTDGLLRGSEASGLGEPGQLVAVEIVDMPYGKPIVLKRVSG